MWPTCAYLIFVFYYMYAAIDVLLRDPRETKHRLVALIATSYALIFFEEFIRALLPLTHSPQLNYRWFMTVGGILPCFLLHFVLNMAGVGSGAGRRRRYYPYVLYVPVVFVPILFCFGGGLAKSFEYVQVGPWKWPVYGQSDYIGITLGIAATCLCLPILLRSRARTSSAERRSVLHIVLLAVCLVIVWNAVFGYAGYASHLPPYPYIYSGLIWSVFLRYAMLRYDFLDFKNRRYEKLFNLTPEGILLVDLQGNVKEANPAARRLLRHVPLARLGLKGAAGEALIGAIGARLPLLEYETTLRNGQLDVHVSVNGEYVTVGDEPLVFLVLRDVTRERADQEKIYRLAYVDSLTGLPNRAGLLGRLAEELRRADERQPPLYVVYIKLDGMTRLNALLGTEAGDRMLQQAAGIVEEAAVRTSGSAARVGGTELLLAARIRDERERQTIDGLRERLERLAYAGDGFSAGLDIRIGAARQREDEDAQRLLERAAYRSLKADGAARARRDA